MISLEIEKIVACLCLQYKSNPQRGNRGRGNIYIYMR